jgi:hypothetical protein
VSGPTYATEPLHRFTEYADSATQLIRVSMRAIHATRSTPRLIRAIGKVKKYAVPEWDDTDHNSQLQQADDDAKFAEEQCAAGFPLLQEFTLVGFWGAFEAFVEDLVIGIISNEPEHLRAEPFAKVRIPLAEFETLGKDDRMRMLLRELQRTLRADQRRGVNSFEAILNSVNLSGPVPEEFREAIWEMHHVRNLIVHRGSCVDRTFADACPRVSVKVGGRIKVSHEQLSHYVIALFEYGAIVADRINNRYPSEDEAKV